MLTTVHEPAADRSATPAGRRASPVARWNAAMVAVGVAVTAFVGWQERWIADDGLIVLRTARQLLAGNGPVFNIGERVEVNTSTVWTALVTLAGAVPGVRLDWAAVGLGLVCAAAGVGLGMDAARRLHGSPGTVLVPAGAAVLLALPPMRDFVTSGLETGLVTLWLAGMWWLLVRLTRGGGGTWSTAVVLGLGPLVRPDLGLVTVLGLALLVALVRPGWRRLLGLGAAAGTLPVAYEVFRMGYYGLLVPSTALAKEASGTQWDQGLVYLRDTVATYWLWVPLAGVVAVLGALVGRHGAWTQRWGTVGVVLLPLVSGLLLGAYVVRVGGDFMHGRLLLPAITAFLLPVMVVPATRRAAVPLVVVAVWFGLMATGLGLVYGERSDDTRGIVDERAHWSAVVDVPNPVSADDFVQATAPVRRSARAVERADVPSLVILQRRAGLDVWRAYPASADVGHTTIPFLNLGMMGAAQPLDVRVVDAIGLSNPLARHATPLFGGRIGHNKDLPIAWFLADEGHPGSVVPAPHDQVLDARRALRCPRIVEVLDSVRAPLTPERFWANLTGAAERTGFRYSRMPSLAAQECGS